MRKPIIFLSVLFALLVFNGCAKTPPADSGTASTDAGSITKEAEDIKNAVESVDTGVTMPADLEKCDLSKFAALNEYGVPKDCSEYGKEEKDMVCSYYADVIKATGEQSNKNVEWGNECSACKFYGEDQIVDAGTHEYRHLGFERKPCPQGMYSVK